MNEFMDKLKEIDKLIVQQQQILELQKQLKLKEEQLEIIANMLHAYFGVNYETKEDDCFRVKEVNRYIGAMLKIVDGFQDNKTKLEELLKNTELWNKVPFPVCK